MGGGLLQLVAHGAQDAYLSGNPQITFWKGLFKRHTNFAMEPFRVRLTGVPSWGNKQSVTLARHADLLYSTYLDVVLPTTQVVSGVEKNVDWNNEQGRLGYNLLDYVELEIGGQVIDRLYSEYLYLWDTLSADANKSYQLYQMVGGGGDSRRTDGGPMAVNTSDTDSASGSGRFYGYRPPSGQGNVQATGRPSSGQVLTVPLPFSYTRNPGAALPLIALQYHEVKINILWNKWQLVTANFRGVPPPPPSSVSIYVDYIYLDVDERRRMAQESHEYLIEQVQFNEEKGLAAGANRIDLTFNHPVKELIWVVQPDRFTNCKIADKFNNSSANYGSPRPVLKPTASQVASVQTPTATLGVGCRLTPFTYTYLDQSWAPGVTPIVSGAGFTQPVFEQHLQINGQDRLDRRGGDYYNKVQPYQHHTGTMKPEGFDVTPYVGTEANAGGGNASTDAPTAVPQSHRGIYTYSFALKPEENQPSGTCNFSRIDTATIVMNMSGNYVVDESSDNVWNVRVYAINYNILRVMSGMAGMAYSN
jgi:hypothetical protein